MRQLLGVAFLGVAFFSLSASPAFADHAWTNSAGDAYHWPTTSSTVSLGDNVGYKLDPILQAVSADWSASVLDTPVIPGANAKPKPCKPTAGRVIEVCSARFGFNGWLGLAQIWVSGVHIQQAVAKINNSYFNGTTFYDDDHARRHVLCQEVGHAIGLDHQSAVSCMDDVNGLFDPAYVDPNPHDYQELSAIYGHSDAAASTFRASADASASGQPRRIDESLYVEDLSDGRKLFTWVFWKDRQSAQGSPF
jgi:hypothetical protein